MTKRGDKVATAAAAVPEAGEPMTIKKIRFPGDMLAFYEREAAAEDRSLNYVVRRALEADIARKKKAAARK